jgi:hypothetical protein
MVKYLNFHNSSFALRYVFNVNGEAMLAWGPYSSYIKQSPWPLKPFLHYSKGHPSLHTDLEEIDTIFS